MQPWVEGPEGLEPRAGAPPGCAGMIRTRKVRVFMTHVEHGERLLTAYDVPQDWLAAFLDWCDEVGTGTEETMGIEVAGGRGPEAANGQACALLLLLYEPAAMVFADLARRALEAVDWREGVHVG